MNRCVLQNKFQPGQLDLLYPGLVSLTYFFKKNLSFFFTALKHGPTNKVQQPYLVDCCRYGNAAQQLVLHSRGSNQTEYPGWKMMDGKEASHDDITAVVVPLHLVASSTKVTFSPGHAQSTQSTWFSCAWWRDLIACGMYVAVQVLTALDETMNRGPPCVYTCKKTTYTC